VPLWCIPAVFILSLLNACTPVHIPSIDGNTYKYIPCTWWFKYDRDYLCVNKSQFVPVIFEPPCTFRWEMLRLNSHWSTLFAKGGTKTLCYQFLINYG
jgi:hypothetical protein